MRVLVTYGWCRTAYVISESLARAGFEVSACGDSALSITRVSRYVDTFDRVPDPFANPRAYALAVERWSCRRGAGVVVPAHEDFVFLRRAWRGYSAGDNSSPRQRATRDCRRWISGAGCSAPARPAWRRPPPDAPASLEEADRVFGHIRGVPGHPQAPPRKRWKGVMLVRDAGQGRPEHHRLVERFGLRGLLAAAN